MVKVGVVNGRFQGLHLGHLEYILEAKKLCEELIIGITNPDPVLTSDNEVDAKRSKIEENPFTYYERMIMVKNALLEHKINRAEFEIVPFPINRPEIIKCYVPLDAIIYITIYDEWGKFKMKTLQDFGFTTHLLWERKMSDRFTTGKEVRSLIKSGGDWEKLVPSSVAQVIKQQNLDQKIKSLK